MITNHTFANQLGIFPQSLSAAVCRHGHYYGIRPIKLPNGRLMWPSNALALMAKGAAK